MTGAPTTTSAVHWIQNSPPAAIVYGSPFAGVSRNTLRGQNISTANLAFFKDIAITEHVKAQLQAQAYGQGSRYYSGQCFAPRKAW